MRVHITLPDELVRELDSRVGARRRSPFIAQAVREALDDQHRWEVIESSLDTISDSGHAWDDAPAAWVRAQRRADESRIG